MKGLVIINGYPNGEKFLRQGERIAEELRLLGVQTDVVKNGEVCAILNADGRYFHILRLLAVSQLIYSS